MRLSSFIKFNQHYNEERGVSSEGWNNIIGIDGGKEVISARTSHGKDAFVLSTSLMQSEQIAQDLEFKCCFLIDKPIKFMNLIAHKIQGGNFGH